MLAQGRNLPLSLPQRCIGDMVHLAQQIPAATMQRKMALGRLVAARAAASPRPGWCAVFLKAYALLAARRPRLRQLYVPYPWAHLYEHSVNHAVVAISRTYAGAEAVFLARLRSPENLGLLEIDQRLRGFKERPIESCGSYRRLLRLSRLPRPLRRLAWSWALHLSGPRQAQLLGTYGISTVAGLGAAQLQLLSPLATTLHYDLFEPDDSLVVRITYDHRIHDAASIARALTDLEDVLTGEIVNELGYLRALEAA